MSDEHEHRDNALVFTARQLPARTALVNRGVALAQRLLAETSTDQRRAAAEECLREVAKAFLWARNDRTWAEIIYTDEYRSKVREACFNAYHWGLIAATTILGMPFSGLDADRCDDPLEHVRVAKRLLNESRLTVDIEPHLLELRNDTFDTNELLMNVEAFLDEVTTLLHPPGETRQSPVAQADIEERIKSQLEEAKTWDGFCEHFKEILKALQDDSAEAERTGTRPKLTLEDAYRKVVTPKSSTDREVMEDSTESRRHRGPVSEVVLPELPSDPETVVLVGPVGIDEATAVWGEVGPGGECVLDWFKNEGDIVTAGEPLAELRGDGWTIPLPSPCNGVLIEIGPNMGSSRLAVWSQSCTVTGNTELPVTEESSPCCTSRWFSQRSP
jgi:hypothetical protein